MPLPYAGAKKIWPLKKVTIQLDYFTEKSIYTNYAGAFSQNDHWPITNSLRNVINSFSNRKVLCFTEKVLKINPRGNSILGGEKIRKMIKKIAEKKENISCY